MFTKAIADIWFLLLRNMTNKIQFKRWYAKKIIFYEDKLDITIYSFCTSLDNKIKVALSELKCYLSDKVKTMQVGLS